MVRVNIWRIRATFRDETSDPASMQTKKRSDDACVKRCTVEDRMVRLGQLVQSKHAENGGGAMRREWSAQKVTGMKAGQLLAGRPPMFWG